MLVFLWLTLAQSFEARLTGQVNDSSGAAVPGVNVTVTNLDTGRDGFKRYVQRGITLQVDQTARVEFTLPVGDVTESVQVTGEAMLLNVDTGAKGQVIDNHEIVDLPAQPGRELQFGLKYMF